MFLNQHEFQRYIQASADRANLEVRWKAGVVPSTNGRIINLPTLDSNATEMAYRELLHYVNHEVDHVLYTDMAGLVKLGLQDASKSFLGAIFNGLEDVRVEWLGGQEYSGDRANSDMVYENIMRTPLNAFEKLKHDPDKKEMLDKAGPLVTLMNKANESNYATASPLTEKLEASLTKKGKEYWEKIKKGDYLDKLKVLRNQANPEKGSAGILELAKRLFSEVYGEDAEKEMERMKKEAEAQAGKGEGKPGDKKGKPSAGKAGEGEGEEGDGEGDGPEGKGERKKNVTVDYSGVLPNSHGGAPKAGVTLDYSKFTDPHEGKPATKDELTVVDFAKGTSTSPSMPWRNVLESTDDHCGYTEECKRLLDSGARQNFAARVRTRLQIRSKDRYEYGTKSGKISQSVLYRGALTECHGLNEKVFKRRIVNDTLDTCVTWLIDTSGSMGGNKYLHAMTATVLMNEAIGNVLGIPIEILGFTDYGFNDICTYIHRAYGVPRLARDTLIQRLAIAGQRMSNNADGDSILFAYDRIRQRREKRKLIIVASDGSPAASRHGIVALTSKVIKSIEASPVQIVGIGLMDTNVTRFYKEHYVIQHAHELETALLSLIDKKVR